MFSRRTTLIILLIVGLVVLGGAAIIVGIQLNQLPQTGDTYGRCYVLTNSKGSTCQMPDSTAPNCTGPICMTGVKYNVASGDSCLPGQMFNCYASGPTCAKADCGPCQATCGADEESVDPVNNACPAGSTVTMGSCAGCNNPYWGCCKPKATTTVYKCGEPDVARGVYCHQDSDCVSQTQAIFKTCLANGTCTTDDTKTLNVECDLRLAYGSGGGNGICSLKGGDTQCTQYGYQRDGECGCKKTALLITTPPTTPPTTTPPRTTPPVSETTTPLPETALVSDEADPIIVGGALFLVGMMFLKSGLYLKLGDFIWETGSLSYYRKWQLKVKKKNLNNQRKDFENKF